jgi:putative ABC transport system permease protein
MNFKHPFRSLRRRPQQIRSEVDDELQFHLEMRIAQLRAQGLNESAARDEALRQFGDFRQTWEVCVQSDEQRETNVERRRRTDELRQDMRHGLRQLRRRWPLAVLALLTLGVGIGASTAIFSATDHVLLRPLPYLEPERVVTLWEADESAGETKGEVAPGNFVEWQKRSQSFALMGLVEPFSFDLATDGPPEAVPSWNVSQGFFEALGVLPLKGRLFSNDEYAPNAAPVVLISEGLWQRRFGSDPAIVGRTLRLDNRPATIVGVLPNTLRYPESNDLWAPKAFAERELQDRRSNYMLAVARLKPGVTLGQAQAEMTGVAERMAAEYPTTNRELRVNLVSLEDQILGSVKPALLVLLGAVAFLLLIACANVASLLLAAGAERSRELAVRASLGAGRGRLVRQLATESLLLAVLGGVAGLFFARLGINAIKLLSPPDLPRVDSLNIDGRVLAFSLIITLLTALLFGLAPALRFSRPDLLGTLRASGRSLTAGRARNRLRGVLVVTEIALALVLLIGSGLLMRSFVELLNNDLGFAVENRATLQSFLWDLNPTDQQRMQKAADIEQALRNTPGVLDVGITSALPFHPHAITAQGRLQITGREVAAAEAPTVHTTAASPSYFRTMGITLAAGRSFSERDRADAPPVAIINEALARRYFPGENPVGKTIRMGVMAAPKLWEIVGVVGDVRPVALDSDARPEVFVPLLQTGSGSLTFVVQTSTDAADMMPLLRSRLWSVDNRQSIYWAATVQDLVRSTLVERRFHLILLASFSAIALILAAIGVYGLISFATQQRTNEIGVRLALGAEQRQIVAMIVSQGLRLALPGVLLGLAGALALTRFLQSMLYGVQATDPLTFAQIALLMIVVAAAASYIPARRAVRASPMRSIGND